MALMTTFFIFFVQTSKIPGLKEIGDKKSIISTLEFFLPLIVSIVALA